MGWLPKKNVSFKKKVVIQPINMKINPFITIFFKS